MDVHSPFISIKCFIVSENVNLVIAVKEITEKTSPDDISDQNSLGDEKVASDMRIVVVYAKSFCRKVYILLRNDSELAAIMIHNLQNAYKRNQIAVKITAFYKA